MKVTAIRSKPFLPPKDDLYAHLDESLAHLPERSVIAISSKVVAIGEGRCVLPPEGVDPLDFKDTLAEEEADLYLPRDPKAPYTRFSTPTNEERSEHACSLRPSAVGAKSRSKFTITNGSFIGSAGIDQSNGNGYFILWPKDPMRSASVARAHLMKRHSIKELGVIITDSKSSPLRNGVTGMTIGYAGFHAQRDYRGKPDIFGRLLKFERLNIADSLAATATLAMGEGDERTPFVLIESAPNVTFTETESDDPFLSLMVPMEDDIFALFMQNAPWQFGRKKK